MRHFDEGLSIFGAGVILIFGFAIVMKLIGAVLMYSGGFSPLLFVLGAVFIYQLLK